MSRDIEEKYDGPGYVYIVRQIGTNFYKIGFTRFHPDRRFKELKIGSPRGLKVETFFEVSVARAPLEQMYSNEHTEMWLSQ